MSLLNSGKFSLTTSTSLLCKVRITCRATNYLDFFQRQLWNPKVLLNTSLRKEKQTGQSFTDTLLFFLLFFCPPTLHRGGWKFRTS